MATPQQNNRDPDRFACPACGSFPVPELFEPVGVALCPHCGALSRRTEAGLRLFGKAADVVVTTASDSLRSGRTRAEQSKRRVREVIAQRLGVPSSAVTAETDLVRDLGADSLDIVHIIVELEEEFGELRSGE